MTTKPEIQVDLSISQAAREELAEALSVLLADTYMLYLKTQNFHWNVKGPRFPELHRLFEEQYQALALAVDLVAERIRALGYPTPATFAEFSKRTLVEEVDGKIPSREMIERLMRDNEKIAQVIRAMMPKAEEALDHATVDLFSERLSAHEKAAWMLRSTLED